jgi:hypothetical protein
VYVKVGIEDGESGIVVFGMFAVRLKVSCLELDEPQLLLQKDRKAKKD